VEGTGKVNNVYVDGRTPDAFAPFGHFCTEARARFKLNLLIFEQVGIHEATLTKKLRLKSTRQLLSARLIGFSFLRYQTPPEGTENCYDPSERFINDRDFFRDSPPVLFATCGKKSTPSKGTLRARAF